MLGKLNHWKNRYKKDVSKLQSEIKRQIGTIDELSKRNNEIQSNNYYYKLWLEERERLIKISKKNNKLLDEINSLKEKLTIEITGKTLTKEKFFEKVGLRIFSEGIELSLTTDEKSDSLNNEIVWNQYTECPYCKKKIRIIKWIEKYTGIVF